MSNLRLGLEAEGKDRNIPTLFVSNFDKVANSKILKSVFKNRVRRIYIGSQGSNVTNFKKLAKLVEEKSDIKIVCRLELVKDVDYILSGNFLNIDLSTREESFSHIMIYELLQGDGIKTNKDDILYSKDKVI